MMPCLFEFYIAYLLSISFAHLLHECSVDMSIYYYFFFYLIIDMSCFSKYYDMNLVNSCNTVLMPSIYVYVVS